MSDTAQVGQYGALSWRREAEDGVVHRVAINPGSWGPSGNWLGTELSPYPQIVKDAAAQHWTPEVVEAYKLAFPWIEPEPPPPLKNISKNIIWERMTEQEAEQALAMLNAQSVKVRMQYDGATYISTEAELYPLVEGAMVQMFGAQRAAVILKPNF